MCACVDVCMSVSFVLCVVALCCACTIANVTVCLCVFSVALRAVFMCVNDSWCVVLMSYVLCAKYAGACVYGLTAVVSSTFYTYCANFLESC